MWVVTDTMEPMRSKTIVDMWLHWCILKHTNQKFWWFYMAVGRHMKPDLMKIHCCEQMLLDISKSLIMRTDVLTLEWLWTSTSCCAYNVFDMAEGVPKPTLLHCQTVSFVLNVKWANVVHFYLLELLMTISCSSPICRLRPFFHINSESFYEHFS